jgi:glucose dehydrogenase
MASPSSRLSTVGANANGVLVTGTSGAEFGIRGFIDGWDPETGKQLWRRYTIPARGEKGNETWPQDNNAWEIGGGSAWITRSYDTELDLMYWGIGNPAPWASQSRPGDAFTPRRCWRCGGRPARSSGIISSLRMIRMTPLTGQKKWRVPLTDRPIWSAMLTTGGGILFTGKEIGEFIALDIESGQQVWQF